MNFNIAYFGPRLLYECRGDFFVPLARGLQELGHTVEISHQKVTQGAINIIMGAYFLLPSDQIRLAESGIKYINFNTEIFTDEGLNYDPSKTDLFGAYLPLIKGGIAAWDGLDKNIGWLHSHGFSGNHKFSKFLWGYSPSLDHISQPIEPFHDAYTYAISTTRRDTIIQQLIEKGINLKVDNYCPQFARDHSIQNSKCILQINQEDIYDHFAPSRTWHACNNGIPSVVEKAKDPDNYMPLAYARFSNVNECADAIKSLREDTRLRLEQKEIAREKLKSRPWMKDIVERMLSESF